MSATAKDVGAIRATIHLETEHQDLDCTIYLADEVEWELLRAATREHPFPGFEGRWVTIAEEAPVVYVQLADFDVNVPKLYLPPKFK